MTERQQQNVARDLARRNEQAEGLAATQQRFREAEAAERERERKEIDEDPRTVAFVRDIEARQKQDSLVSSDRLATA